MKLQSYGVTQQVKHQDEYGLHLEELAINGFTIVGNVLDKKKLDEARERLDKVYAIQEKKFGAEYLASIQELNLARCPLAYDDFFVHEIAANEIILSVLKKVLGDYFILHLQNGIINMPRQPHHQNSWHRDLPYQNFVINKPLAIGCLYCIDDFTIENGCTNVLPFSHQRDFIPSNEYVEKFKVPAIAKAGSVIMFDAMLFHAAGYNSSENIRRGINNVYVTPIIKQQISLPQLLQGKFSDDINLARLLGYESEVPVSDDAFRERRKMKTIKSK